MGDIHTVSDGKVGLDILQTSFERRVASCSKQTLVLSYIEGIDRSRLVVTASFLRGLDRSRQGTFVVLRDVVLHLFVPVNRLRIGPSA